ncbi:hypothetical protein HI914_02840 [Erysiphe necator]|nr:hypothetical protein HI914_02840 [Erysiphe necator]
MIVPFFSYQQFWGNVEKNQDLILENLADGIRRCSRKEVRDSAKRIAESIETNGDSAANTLLRNNDLNDFERPGEPITGSAIATLGTITAIVTGTGGVSH